LEKARKQEAIYIIYALHSYFGKILLLLCNKVCNSYRTLLTQAQIFMLTKIKELLSVIFSWALHECFVLCFACALSACIFSWSAGRTRCLDSWSFLLRSPNHQSTLSCASRHV